MLFLCNEKTNIKKKLSRPRGTRDILFSQAFLFFQIQKKITQVLEKNNYYPVIFPTLEYEHLFRSNLENSEVGKEMYTFPDKKGRILALRPEGTLSVARVCYQNGLLTEGAVHKFYYWANMFRYERPQKDRYREFWQLGVELLGVKGIQADLEILQLIKEIFLCVEIRDITFRLNYLGSKEIQKKYQEKLVIFLDQKKILLCFNCQERYQKGNLLRILDCIICRKKCEFPSYNIIWTPEIVSYVDSLNSFLKLLQIPFVYDYWLVRGLDYYTGLVFEVYLNEEDKSVLGGGRYDELYKCLGGKSFASVGFALGIDRLINFLSSKKELALKRRLDVFFLNYYELAYGEVILWKNELISQGLDVDYNLNVIKKKVFLRSSIKTRVLFVIQKEIFLEGFVQLKSDDLGWKKVRKEELVKMTLDIIASRLDN